MKNGKQSNLKFNEHDWAIFSIVNNAKIHNKTIIEWNIIAGKKYTVEIAFHVIRKFRNELIIRAVGESSKVKLANLVAGKEKINFYLPSDLVLFQTSIKQLEENGDVKVTFPTKIAQIDRRKDIRLKIESGMKVNLNFKKEISGIGSTTQVFEKSVYDLSGGGLSFIISRTEKSFFKKNDKIFAAELSIDQQEIFVSGEVKLIQDIKPEKHNGLNYKGWKVSLAFEDLDQSERDIIEEFVFRYEKYDEVI